MQLSALAKDYDEIRNKLAETVPLRERLFQFDSTKEGIALEEELKRINFSVYALADYNREILYSLIKIFRDDIKFRRMISHNLFGEGEIEKILEQDSPHAKVLRGYKAFFAEIVQSINPKLRMLRRELQKQTKIEYTHCQSLSALALMPIEKKIQTIAHDLNRILAPYQILGTMAHQEMPGTMAEQEVSNPERFVTDPQHSLWILVKLISEMEIYLMAVQGIKENDTRLLERKIVPNNTNFNRKNYTATSEKDLDMPEAVEYARSLGGVLQSAREAVEFRLNMNGAEHADHSQITRTAVIYFEENGAHYIAFDDHPIENILLIRPREGCVIQKGERAVKWILPIADPIITAMIQRAKKQGRVVPVPNNSHDFDLKHVRAILGDIAQQYISWINEDEEVRKRKDKFECETWDTGACKQIAPQHAWICTVRLGGRLEGMNFKLPFCMIKAYYACDQTNHSRGVYHPIETR